jgi:RNA-directed DNA polymerase
LRKTRETRIPPERESDPQGKPIEMRAKERGKSECHPAMGWIRVVTSSYAKAGRLPQGLSEQENWSYPTKEEKQMTAEEDSAGASFHGVTNWHDIDWYAANRNVRRLQARIVQATKEKRWNKVKALQRLLTHSFSGKVLAVRRVTENQGKIPQEWTRSLGTLHKRNSTRSIRFGNGTTIPNRCDVSLSPRKAARSEV